MSDIKQVIVVRKDLNMRKGKIAAQVSHACMKVFFDVLFENRSHFSPLPESEGQLLSWTLPNKKYFEEYVGGAFKKIVVYVESESDLIDIYSKAQSAGIHASLVLDSGLTEFKGVKTYTCAAIGPWDGDEINKITGHLPLL